MRPWPPRIWAWAGLATMLAGVLLLQRFPPTRYGFYPACPIHAWLGLSCPGCGGTRAVAALAAGHWGEALRQNVCVTLFALAAAIYGIWQIYFATRWNRWRPVRIPAWGVKGSLGALALFTLGRNLGVL